MGINWMPPISSLTFKKRPDGADIQLCFPYPAKSAFAEIAAVAREKLAAEGVANARFSLQIKIHPHTTQGGVEKLPGVKNIIAVASAKGGGRQIHHRR